MIRKLEIAFVLFCKSDWRNSIIPARGEALKGSELGNYWRYRVGNYRILCDIQDHKLVVLVIEIGHRREVYR